jgi:hypothetical protein
MSLISFGSDIADLVEAIVINYSLFFRARITLIIFYIEILVEVHEY